MAFLFIAAIADVTWLEPVTTVTSLKFLRNLFESFWIQLSATLHEFGMTRDDMRLMQLMRPWPSALCFTLHSDEHMSTWAALQDLQEISGILLLNPTWMLILHQGEWIRDTTGLTTAIFLSAIIVAITELHLEKPVCLAVAALGPPLCRPLHKQIGCIQATTFEEHWAFAGRVLQHCRQLDRFISFLCSRSQAGTLCATTRSSMKVAAHPRSARSRPHVHRAR